MKVLIIDDNSFEALHLGKILEQFEEISEILFANSFRTALKCINDFKVEAVFTDIDLDGENGIELMKNFPSVLPKIFVSAHPELAFESFTVQPLHFIQKPVREKDVAVALQRILEKLNRKSILSKKFVFIQSNGQHIKILLDDIFWIKSAENYVELKVRDTKYLVLANLTQFLKQLPENEFLRIQKTIALPVASISNYSSEFVTSSNELYGIGSAYKKHVLEVLGKLTIKRKS